jgi:hypothetical protein
MEAASASNAAPPEAWLIRSSRSLLASLPKAIVKTFVVSASGLEGSQVWNIRFSETSPFVSAPSESNTMP